MANRRMFSKKVTNSSNFLMMSQSAQALYFHIGMNADDDGFCEIFTITRMTESKPDDIRALLERNFIYVVDNKVCIVKDWYENNFIRSDRYEKSKYLKDAKMAEIHDIVTKSNTGIPLVYQTATEDRIGQDRIGQIDTSVVPTPEVPFSLESEIKKMEDNKRRDINIIALYFEHRKPNLINKEQVRTAIKRHLRAAKDLTPFTDEQIVDAIPKAKKITSDWTLETLVKCLTK